MSSRLSRHAVLTFSIPVGLALAGLASGCAGVKNPDIGGSRGTGGAYVMPSIPGLVSLDVSPSSQTVALTQTGGMLTGTATFTATGHLMDGTTRDVTAMVGWPSPFKSLVVQAGVATVTAPGTYTIMAASGSINGSAQLIASFTGSVTAPGFDPSAQPGLDGTPSGGAVSIAYPLDGAIFPPNLSPIYVHVSKSGNQTMARLNFAANNVNVNYYGTCETADPTSGLADPGPGCYVKLPLSFTQLFIAVSENQDIKLTARVSGGGSALSESNSVNVAWANVPLSGGLYYWTTMTDGAYPGYTRPKDASTGVVATTGTGIQRYDFSMDGAAPELVYTDQGTPPNFTGSPPSPASDGGEGTCIGCHAITNDGTKMALTINGSNAAGFALLDIATKSLQVVNPPAGNTGLVDLRVPNFAANTTFNPAGDGMVNMYRSKLYLTPIITSTTSPLAHQGEVVPSWSEYKGDPFWSQDGKYVVFTSFATPDVLSPYNDGLNGDMKKGGQIMIASSDGTMVNDDAKVLVPRQGNVTSYYPVVSNDSQLIAFSRSTCGTDPDLYGNGYGSQTCDGYDDSSGTLWLTTPGGGAPTYLANANGVSSSVTGTNDNSWPRWSPDNGLFRGQRLYWLSFSSRRPYGLQVNTGAPGSSKPQLWFAAVLTGNELFTDPSFAPVWLPNQNPNQGVPNGNHVPQWVKVAVVIPG
jgi:hypothetical protein